MFFVVEINELTFYAMKWLTNQRPTRQRKLVGGILPPIMQVRLDHFPKVRGDNIIFLKFETTTHNICFTNLTPLDTPIPFAP